MITGQNCEKQRKMTSEKAFDDSPVTENENNFSQENESQWENGQLGRNWFSPPITSTQISFDLISLDDTSQELIDLSEETLFAEDSALCDDSIVSETPPPQGELLSNRNNITDYLFQNSESDNVKVPSPKVTPKRHSSQKKSKRPLKMKKLEGYTCKLNGGVYQVCRLNL